VEIFYLPYDRVHPIFLKGRHIIKSSDELLLFLIESGQGDFGKDHQPCAEDHQLWIAFSFGEIEALNEKNYKNEILPIVEINTRKMLPRPNNLYMFKELLSQPKICTLPPGVQKAGTAGVG
jgi:hypothetical protein